MTMIILVTSNRGGEEAFQANAIQTFKIFGLKHPKLFWHELSICIIEKGLLHRAGRSLDIVQKMVDIANTSRTN